MKKAELLIPVGNKECLIAAIHNGADAIYLGGKKFGARAYSENFTNEEIIQAIKTCHLYGVKIYITVNTMIYNDEINEVLEYLNFLYENDVDAVITQDLGIINLARKYIPNLEIHVSTQAHNHNEEGISYYQKLGCQRVVLDRELSLEEINNLNTNIEKEIFVYGALCICYSGNCLQSYLNGGRSANRGMCVGACRLPYKLEKNNQISAEGYLLSTKDLNTLEHLDKILSSNIDSLKVEGRMKSKEYVAIVTKTFRKAIDSYYQNKKIEITNQDKINLLKTYNRGFTKGYLFNADNILNQKNSNHQGIIIGKVIEVNNKKIKIKLTEDIHQEDAIRFVNTNTGTYLNTLYNEKGLLVNSISKNNICLIDNKDQLPAKKLLGSNVLKTIDYLLNKELNTFKEKKIPLKMEFNAKLNKQISLEVTDNKNIIKVYGIIPEKAQNRPITKEKIQEQLNKLGNTPYCLEELKIAKEENIFINIVELNNLRRLIITKITEARTSSNNKNILPILKEPKITNTTKPKISILVRNEEQLKIALKNKIDIIYTQDKALYKKYHNYPNIYLRLERVNNHLEELNNERLLCTELGSILKYQKTNQIRSDYYLNIANEYSLKALEEQQVSSITLSIECTLDKLLNIKNKSICEVIIYGTIESMIIKNNIFNLNNEKSYLIDSNNNKYKLIYSNNFTHIMNHTKINLISEIPKLKTFGYLRIELLDETKEETEKIINKIKSMI